MSFVVSFRVGLEEKRRLGKIAEQTGKPIGDIVRSVLADQKLTDLIEAAAENGRLEMEAVWCGRAYRLCKICHEEVVIDFAQNPRAEEIFNRAFKDWVHGKCLSKKGTP